MSKATRTALFALLIPAMATLAACAHEAADDAYAAPATSDAAPAASSMPSAQTTPPAQTMPPAETMPPAQTMPPDQTMPPAGDTGMAADEMSFADMDTNQDGGISMDELTPDQMLHKHFAMADADGNGMLSEAEVTRHRADMGK